MIDFETHPVGTAERLDYLASLLDRVVERGLGYGLFDDNDTLWREAAKETNRDLDTGNRNGAG